MNTIERIQRIQTRVGVKADGEVGAVTVTALERVLGIVDLAPTVQPVGVSDIAELICAKAESQVGIKEVGNNGGLDIREYQRATWLEPGAWPWCAAFVCWVLREALKGRVIPFALPRTAGAWDFENWAREQNGKGVQLLKPRQAVQRGDLVIFSFSHIGICLESERSGIIRTVEGNTNADGGREGDGVYRKTRRVELVRSCVRFVA